MPTALDPLALAIKISDLSYTVAPFVILKFLLYHVTSQTFEGSLLLAGLPVTGRMKPKLLVYHQTSLPGTNGQVSHTPHPRSMG